MMAPPSSPRSAWSRLWRYLLLFVILLVLWITILVLLQPRSLNSENLSMWKLLGTYFGPPLLAVFSIFMFQNAQAASVQKTEGQPAAGQANQVSQAQSAEKAKNAFTLEVLGLGMAVAKFRQSQTWQEIEKHPRDFVLPTDPKEYPWAESEKVDVSIKRSADTLEYAASWFVEKWAIPVLAAGPALHNPEMNDYLDAVIDTARTEGGMHWHEFKVIDRLYDDQPERIFAQAFAFFDKNPQAPALILYVRDGVRMRNSLRSPGAPALLTDGYFKKSDPTEAMVALLLIRRDRVETMRPHATNDKTGKPVGPAPAQPFQPSTWLPQPWNTHQFDQFDKLPTLGYLHRPQIVSYLDAHGHPLRQDHLNEAFRQGWLTAVQTLPPESKVTRVFFDYGTADQGRRIIPLAQTLNKESHLDALQPGQGYNLTTNLGDTGAASPFIQIALGIIASYRHNDVSASVTLKRKDSATIMLISPPLKKGRHPGGIDALDFGLAQ